MALSKRSQWTVAGLVGMFVGILVALSPTLHAQSNLGKWKLNVAKSSYDPGPAPKSDDRVYEAWEGDGIKAVYSQVQADGTRTSISWSTHYDGKDYKYTGSATTDAISIKRIDPNTIEAILKKDGKTLRTVRSVTSNDGKVLTQTTIGGIGANNQRVNKNVVVFDRQ